MKKILSALLLSVSLSGCAIYEAYMMTGFDSSEYLLITEIRTDAQRYKDECADESTSKQNAVSIDKKTKLFESYSEYIPHNKNVITASKELNNISKGLVERYRTGPSVSPTFCKIKFESIEKNAVKMQETIGKRPR
jgi:hypothetical protein